MTAVVPSKCVVMDRAAFLRLLGPMKDLLEVRRGALSVHAQLG